MLKTDVKFFFSQQSGKVLPSKLDWFSSTVEAIKASSELSERRWALFVETISVNGLTYFVSVIAF